MNQERKKIIINEIKYWNQSKLLPKQYCDFLLSLYSEGEESFEPTSQKKVSIAMKQLYGLSLLSLLLFFISFVVIHFTDFSLAMQIAFVVIVVGIMTYLSMKLNNKSRMLAQLSFLLSSILIFLWSVQTTDLIFQGNEIAMSITILLSCIAWVLVGLKWSMIYFLFAGIASVLFLLFFLLF
ncbi:hypothetical protein [Bacillus alkalicellulosilyticus]|uniref:hypothetical protein n=1 Tax=Alkalihalobacterium alkalicellulosilyticum TaxID=1912214 RepID=UPI00099705EB|nr:hypothetical protein [Bacillus alkalicellulosilyticus]